MVAPLLRSPSPPLDRGSMKRRIYEILTNPRADDIIGRLVSFALLLLIAANVTASVLETDVELARGAPRFFRWFERVSVVIFTGEYLLRLWSCTADPRFAAGLKGRLRLAMTPMSLVDLAAIAPSFVELFLPGVVDLRFLRVLRLLRLFRLMRVRRLADAFSMLVRVIYSKRLELGVSMAVVVVAMLLAAGAMYMIEHTQPGTQFTSIPRAMWWSICTVTTIGYGDMVPTSSLGQTVAGFVAFIGICSLALPVGILSSGFLEEINRKRADPVVPDRSACPHCGGSLG
jgi:voltage-gated potassium channel